MFKEGDLILINGKNVSVDKQTKKLHWKKLSPFKVQHVVNTSLYKLDISENYNIYNVFNVVLLKLFQGEHYVSLTLTAKDMLLNQDNEFEVKVIIDSYVSDRRLKYLVK